MALINSLKFDRSVKRAWQCELVSTNGTQLIFEGVFDKDVEHSELGLIREATISREYYWLDRWFNIFEFREPDGSLRNFYCNISMPPTWIVGRLEYIDLDVDIVVWPDGGIKILDLDEFETSSRRYAFTAELKDSVNRAIDDLLTMIDNRDAPFETLRK